MKPKIEDTVLDVMDLSEIMSGNDYKMVDIIELLKIMLGNFSKVVDIMGKAVKDTENLEAYKNFLNISGKNGVVRNALEEAVRTATENLEAYKKLLKKSGRIGKMWNATDTLTTYRKLLEMLETESSTTNKLMDASEKAMKAAVENLEAYRKLLKSLSGHNNMVLEALEEAVKVAVEDIEIYSRNLVIYSENIASYRELSEIKSKTTRELLEIKSRSIMELLEIKSNTFRELLKRISGNADKIKDALEEAVKAAAENIAGFDESTKVLVACDVSGSMQQHISPNSSIMNYDIGLMLGMLLKSRCKNVVSGIFGKTWKIVDLPDNGVLSNVDEFYKREGEVGYSTNGYLVVQDLIDRKETMDKIMIFTDCQMWDSSGNDTHFKDVWKKYKTIAPEAKLYLFDLAGYGNVPLNITGDDVHLIAGWSDKIFDILQAIDNGSDALKVIHEIEF